MRRGLLISILPIVAAVSSAFAQEPARKGEPKGPARPPLFFREEWKQIPGGGEHPVTANAPANPNLEMKLYGASAKEIQLTGAANDENNPIHLWTGLVEGPTAVTLRDKSNYADLTGMARIRWVIKVSGFHQVHPIVKLANAPGWWVTMRTAPSLTGMSMIFRWLRCDGCGWTLKKWLPRATSWKSRT
jgi:hypothetical protein